MLKQTYSSKVYSSCNYVLVVLELHYTLKNVVVKQYEDSSTNSKVDIIPTTVLVY